MEKSLNHVFKETAIQEAPAGFRESVYQKIGAEAKRYERSQKYMWGIFSCISFGALVVSSVYAFKMFSASSFGNYFSLIFSDPASLAPAWKELALSLVESLPIVGVGIFLTSVLAVLYCLRSFSKQTGLFFTNIKTA